MSIPPVALETIIEASGIGARIQALLPVGVRHRQLRASTLILGMMLTQADRRPAHLTQVHAALTALPAADQRRLGVTEEWKTAPDQLTYRQAERTFGLITAALEKQKPDGIPSAALATVLVRRARLRAPPARWPDGRRRRRDKRQMDSEAYRGSRTRHPQRGCHHGETHTPTATWTGSGSS